MARKQLYINGVGTGDYGIYISSDTYLNAPAPDYVAHQVPGRNGDLLGFSGRLNNVARKFTCYIPDSAQSNFDGFKKLLYSQMGYVRIESDYEPDTYQRGYLAEDIEAEPFQSDEALRVTFDLTFSCEPQKYYKTSTAETISFHHTSDTWNAYIVPRSHPIIQQLLPHIPVRDVPEGDAFLVQFTSPIAMARGITLTNAQFSSTDYEGFVAMAVIENVEIDYLTKIRSFIGYSTSGEISASDYTYTTETMYSGVAVVIPADAECTWTASINQSKGYPFSNTVTMQPQGTISDSNAIGLHHTLEISGEYGQGQVQDYEKGNIQVVLVGLLNGSPSFSGFITVDTKPFRAVTESGKTYQAKIVIDSENMTGYAEVNGKTINMSESIGIWGSIDGIADEVRLICYRESQSLHLRQPFYYQNFVVTPRWWKI